MSSPTTAVPRLVEGQRVQDLRCLPTIRYGVIVAVGEFLPYVAAVWEGTAILEQIDDPATVLKPLRGPLVRAVAELYFIPPDCPYDDTTLNWDAGWNCPTCKAWWNDAGTEGGRACAACHDTATIIDADGRFLCDRCAPTVQDGDTNG